MKKLFLLLVSGSIAMGAGAQERHMSVMPASSQEGKKALFSKQYLPQNTRVTNPAAKTTAGGSRYYNYAFDYVDTAQKIASGGVNGMENFTVLMWNDTNMIYQFTGTTPGSRHINLVSVASIFDPHANSFNDSTYFEGLMKLTSGDAYVIDSVMFFGKYEFNPAKTTVVDTLRLSFVKGNGGSEASDDIFGGGGTSGGHYGSISFLDLHYDSVLNIARHGMTWGTPSGNVKDIYLDNTSWGDTTAQGTMIHRVALPTALSVSAGGFAGMSWTFISGDPARSTSPTAPTGGDTVIRANGTTKFNNYQPFIACLADLSSDALQFPPFDATDHNAGYYKSLPSAANGWSETYVPQWAWSSSGGSGASSYQYPNVTWHVTCSTCGVITNNPSSSNVKTVQTISTVNAFPNPAVNQLSVPFTLSQSANVTVTLTNMVGQVVAAQNMGNVASGTAVINTAAIPNGVYFYTVIANNERNTGRVVVAH